MPSLLIILSSPFFIRALVASILISLITATMGSFTVFRGLTFITATISHSVWAGAALGLIIQIYLINWLNPIIVTTIVGVTVAIFIALLSGDGSAEKFDVAIGIMFALSMSFAILFVSMLREYASRTFGIIIGDILLLSNEDLMSLIILSSIVVLLTMIFINQFTFISFDMEGAEASGLNSAAYQLLMFILIAFSIVVLVKSVGAILVYAILTIPPATANEIADNVQNAMVLAFVFSLISTIGGLFLSIYLNVAPSALMGLIATGIYFIVKGINYRRSL